MKWAHLPMAGGIYDQDPMLWHWWSILWHEEALEAERENKKREQEMERNRAKAATSRGIRHRRR